jgi:hypothetical protein
MQAISSIALLLLLAQSLPPSSSVQAVVKHLVGVMDTTRQASENPKIAKVQMTTCEVSVSTDSNSVYLYQEQALVDKLNQPYRQRLLEIKARADGRSVESKSYKLSNAVSFINFCHKSLTERRIQSSDIGEPVCRVFLTPIEGGYQGETPPEGCPTTARGAVKITNTIILRPDGMDTSDRGYDVQGQQIWGARDSFYQYRWVAH